MYLFSTDKGWVKEAKKDIVPCLAAHKCSAYLWEYLPPAPLGSSFTSSTPQTESKVRRGETSDLATLPPKLWV